MRTTLLGLAVVAVVGCGAAVWFLKHADGFSARSEPTTAETVVVRAARRLAVSGNAVATNPVPFTVQNWADSRAHFADHCAGCHGNDGSGQTELGQGLYPKAPDMRLATTQNLSDGELYWIIENGIRLTGMPAWGSGRADDEDTWKLVHFIRHLKELSPEQLEQMQALNPKTPSELKEEEDDRQFLEGKDVEPSPEHAGHHH